MKQSYEEYKKELNEKQSERSYKDIKQQMVRQNEFALELDNIQPQKHNWTDRGLKHTCENAGHPYHEAWKVRKPTI